MGQSDHKTELGSMGVLDFPKKKEGIFRRGMYPTAAEDVPQDT